MTAAEWLIEQLKEQIRKSAHNELGTNRTGDYRIGLSKAIDFCEQAKEMEKQQIIDAWIAEDNILQKLAAEKYYNETYKQQTS